MFLVFTRQHHGIFTPPCFSKFSAALVGGPGLGRRAQACCRALAGDGACALFGDLTERLARIRMARPGPRANAALVGLGLGCGRGCGLGQGLNRPRTAGGSCGHLGRCLCRFGRAGSGGMGRFRWVFAAGAVGAHVEHGQCADGLAGMANACALIAGFVALVVVRFGPGAELGRPAIGYAIRCG